MEKNRFVLFEYSDYYPLGGMNDAVITFNTREELLNQSKEMNEDGYDVFDTDTFKVGHGENPIEAYEDALK